MSRRGGGLEETLKGIVDESVRDGLVWAQVSQPLPWKIGYRVHEAAAMLGIGEDRVRAMIREGRLRTLDLGPSVRSVVISVISMLELDRGIDATRFFRLVESDDEVDASLDDTKWAS